MKETLRELQRMPSSWVRRCSYGRTIPALPSFSGVPVHHRLIPTRGCLAPEDPLVSPRSDPPIEGAVRILSLEKQQRTINRWRESHSMKNPGTLPIDTQVIAPVGDVNGEAVPLRITTDRSRLVRRWLTPAALISLQLGGLWALNFAGFWVVQKTALPIPGNLVGMLALFVLLVAGAVKVSWFELTGSFLIKHLAFFFVPITVGLMNAGPLLLAHGLGIVVVLTISAAIGILLAGFVSQLLLAIPWRAEEQR